MTYTEIEGDLLTLGLPAIGHGCNCRGSMGGGIAAQLRDRYPQMSDAYRAKCRDGSFRLGGFFAWETADTVIYNLATQQEPGADARLGAIEESVRAALADAQARGLPTLGLPRLGSGIGGLQWADVSDTLRSLAAESPVDLTVVSRPRVSPARHAPRRLVTHTSVTDEAGEPKTAEQIYQELLAGMPPAFRQAVPPPQPEE